MPRDANVAAIRAEKARVGAMGDGAAVINGRRCGACTLCCKVLGISELGKPQGQWCPHCASGRGCKIYDARPQECRTFYCGYLTWNMMDDREHWFPAKSKMVVVSEEEGTCIAIYVDPGRPAAWQEKPYYSDIKHWSVLASIQTHHVLLRIGKRTIVVFPDSEVHLGVVADDERIITFEASTPRGLELDALKLKADDPRIAGSDPGRRILRWPRRP
jgi:hypothetical protein